MNKDLKKTYSQLLREKREQQVKKDLGITSKTPFLPEGGLTGQVVAKSANNTVEWENISTGMFTKVIKANDESKEAFESNTGVVTVYNYEDDTISWRGFIFEDLAVPAGAVLKEAYLNVVGYVGTSSTLNVSAENSLNPAEFAQTAYNISNRTLGNTSIQWSLPEIVDGVSHTSPDIVSVINELGPITDLTKLNLILTTQSGNQNWWSLNDDTPPKNTTLTLVYEAADTVLTKSKNLSDVDNPATASLNIGAVHYDVNNPPAENQTVRYQNGIFQTVDGGAASFKHLTTVFTNPAQGSVEQLSGLSHNFGTNVHVDFELSFVYNNNIPGPIDLLLTPTNFFGYLTEYPGQTPNEVMQVFVDTPVIFSIATTSNTIKTFTIKGSLRRNANVESTVNWSLDFVTGGGPIEQFIINNSTIKYFNTPS